MSEPAIPPIWKSLPTKLRAYEALYLMNRCFEATLLSLEQLEGLGMFRLEYLNEYRVWVEYTRAEANEELTDTLHEYEMDESGRFDEMRRRWEQQRADPDDVFFEAQDRKQRIKDQIKDLQGALEREHRKKNKIPKRKKAE